MVVGQKGSKRAKEVAAKLKPPERGACETNASA